MNTMPDVSAPDLYAQILRAATLPVLALVIFICWRVTVYMMDPKRRQARRNREIRKAVEERRIYMEEMKARKEDGADAHVKEDAGP